MHASSVTLMYVPSSQEAGLGTVLPLGHLWPAAHSKHADSPAEPWYRPVSQAAHCPLLSGA